MQRSLKIRAAGGLDPVRNNHDHAPPRIWSQISCGSNDGVEQRGGTFGFSEYLNRLLQPSYIPCHRFPKIAFRFNREIACLIGGPKDAAEKMLRGWFFE